MSQFSFLGTWKDSWAILDSILEGEDSSLIPDLKYAQPEPLCVRVLDDDVKDTLMHCRNLFIWGKTFSSFPPFLQRIPDGINAGKYFLEIAKGGPGLELTLPPCYTEDKVLNLGPGTLSYQRQWFNPEANAWQKPTEQVKAAFKEVTTRIKRHLVRYPRSGQREVWIGHDAVQLVESKEARITGFEGSAAV